MTGASRFLNLLQRVTLVIGVIVTALMMLLTVVDVTLRYAINKSFYGTIEVTQFMLAIVIFAGLALVTRDRSHIVVSLFEPFMLRHAPRLYEVLFSSFNLVGAVAITYLMSKAGLELLRLDQRTLVLDLPQGWLLLALGGLCAIAVVFGIEVFRTRPDLAMVPDRIQHASDI
jgi:TRAP-type C4-dicarboxylate transport system permease small subunit